MSETPPLANEDDIRPVVGRMVSNRGVWLFVGALAVGAGGLFGALEARRAKITSPAISVPAAAGNGMIASPPNIVIPADNDGVDSTRSVLPYLVRQPERQPPDADFIGLSPSPDAVRDRSQSRRSHAGGEMARASPPVPPQPAGPAHVYQASAPKPFPETTPGIQPKDARAHASRFVGPSTTVPQGTVIQAVLETALDSNHPGFARAVVSRDVSSFDGTRVLIPRGSKLFGEYKADVSLGQNRALIQWRRLTRPDGTIIDVDSPTADTLGRAGVRGKVDTHFFQRFAGAILQSVLDIGVQAATREAAGDTVILALPNGARAAPVASQEQIRPTIKVRQGASVSVFVGRDLDFSDVER